MSVIQLIKDWVAYVKGRGKMPVISMELQAMAKIEAAQEGVEEAIVLKEIASMAELEGEREGVAEALFSEEFMDMAVAEAVTEAEAQVLREFKEFERKHKLELDNAEVISFCEAGLQAGTIKQEWIEKGLIGFMSHLSEDPAVFEFSEEAPSVTRLAWFKGFLKAVDKLTSGR